VTLRSNLTSCFVIFMAVVLTACRSSGPVETTSRTQSSSGSRYALENDIAVNEPIDLASIRDVVPREERRTSAGNKSPYTVNGRTYLVLENEAGYSETGMASWYGRKFHGHLTSNGEVYDMFQLSAAHTTLPIPSYVRVTNLDNGRSVIARINDRGPFHPGRIVDMSYAGAVLLGYARTGTARVRVEAITPGAGVLSAAPVAPPAASVPETVVYAAPSVETVAIERQLIEENRGAEYLQVGAFSSEASARNLMAQLQGVKLQGVTRMDVVVHSESGSNGAMLHKVRIGPLTDEVQARAVQDAVVAARLGNPFKVRL
jgi:rare lipoprotein A